MAHQERSERELRRIQRELETRARSLGLQLLAAGEDVTRNRVVLEVVAVTDEQRRALDAAYGPGTVEVVPALESVP